MSESVICRYCGRQVENLTLCECRANAFQPIDGFRMMPVNVLAQIEEHENRKAMQQAETCRCGHSRAFHGGECMHVEYDDGTDLWCPCLAFEPVEMGKMLTFAPRELLHTETKRT